MSNVIGALVSSVHKAKASMQDPSKPPSELPKEPPIITSGRTKTLELEYNVAGLLCYVPVFPINVIFSVLWMATEPEDSRFLRFCAAQSLVLSGLWIAIAFVLWLTMWIFNVLPFLRLVSSAIGFSYGIIFLAYLVTNIWVMVKAHSGKTCEIPIIGPYAQKYM
jgi:uncharacterized membrane protein